MATLRTVLVAVLISLGLIRPHIGYSATNVVLNLNDGLTAGTLRSVIANSLAGDTIIFSNNLSGTILLTNGGPLVINKDLTIEGPGAKVITVSGNNSQRVFIITNTAARVTGLSIAHGRVTGANGAAGSAGQSTFAAGLINWHSVAGLEVTVLDCAFIENEVVGGNGGGTPVGGGGAGGDAYGGAVFNNSQLRMANCCFAGNSVTGGNGGAGAAAGGRGGAGLGSGILNAGSLVLINCTFAANKAQGGNGGSTAGGISFPGNGGNAEGVGIYNAGQLGLLCCTIASNSASPGEAGLGAPARRGGTFGGGIRNYTDSADVGNTIVANNTALDGPDVSGVFTSQGFNLIGATNGSSGFTATTDQTGTTNNPTNPMLGPLQDNGGQTLTLALLTGSPALDQGNSFGLPFDQRRSLRPSDFPSISNASDGADIGAFEMREPLLSIVPSANNVLLSWSIFNPESSLQSTTNAGSTNWVSVGGMAAVVGNSFVVTNTVSDHRRFFRLSAP